MNTVEISITGPVMENLARVTIEDQYDNDTFCLDNQDVEEARQMGLEELFSLIKDNAGRGLDILRAAKQNDSPVTIDGETVPRNIIDESFPSFTP